MGREDGLGRLYYRAVLNVYRPVEDVRPLDAGMRIERAYCRSDEERGCTPLTSLQLGSDQTLTAQLTLVLPKDSYYVMVEDHIPAGMEILNRRLKTSQQGIDSANVEVQFEEDETLTAAAAVLRLRDGAELEGRGQARRNPADPSSSVGRNSETMESQFNVDARISRRFAIGGSFGL